VTRVGGSREVEVDVRVLSATNADLPAAIRQGRFREDLYYRLAGYPVSLPPLRERKDDSPLLARHFLALFATELGRPAPQLSDGAMQALADYPFPGNIRELKTVLERAMIDSGGSAIEKEHLLLEPAGATAAGSASTPSVEDLPLNLEKANAALVERALRQAGGNVSQAAKLAVNSTQRQAFSQEHIEMLQDLAAVLTESFRRMEDLRTLEGRHAELEREIAEREQREKIQRAFQHVRDAIWNLDSFSEVDELLSAVHNSLKLLEIPVQNLRYQRGLCRGGAALRGFSQPA
jgi:transcriptional regulator with GAF, ATPase, and Fis domain